MKIKNDFVTIKNGNQEIKVHNMILDTYIRQIINNQIKIDNRIDLSMKCIFIKFDTELDFNESSVLSKKDFDLSLEIYKYETEESKKGIINNYRYSLIEGEIAVDIKENTAIYSFEKFNKKKITAIGFSYYSDGEVYACVDTRNYNIYYDSSQVLSITRRDILATDGYFYSEDNKIQAPIHLCKYKTIFDKNYEDYLYFAVLKSIGLGHNTYKMSEEHLLLPYEEHLEINNNSISIKDKLTIQYKSEGVFPDIDLFPEVDLYPARIIVNDLYPSRNVYPGIDVYPVYSAYQYVQLKYEIYYKESETSSSVDTGNYYLISMPIENKRKIKMNILYERA